MAAKPAPRRTGEHEPCFRCGITETVLILLSSGHVGRACGTCRMLRHPRPYVSKAVFLATPPTPDNDGQKENPHVPICR